ncbi:MAG: hypothetical protein ACRDLT_05075 [Solirubrobacteraceae bacterium]
MSNVRTIRAVGAALALSATLAACGGGAGGGAKSPSALDPANMVPATAVAYAAVAIKPQGHVKANLIEAIDSIAGKGSAQQIEAQFVKGLGKPWRQLKTWAGQRAAIALTALPAGLTSGGAQTLDALDDDLVIVIPTNHPSAARMFLARNIHDTLETWKVVGHYALVGGQSAVTSAAATTGKTSLAAVPGFKSDMAQLGDGELFAAYAPLHQLYEQALPLLKSLSQHTETNALSQGAKQAPPGSSVALGLSALHNQFRMDVIEHGIPQTSSPPTGAATDVSALPASSWLAIALGGSLTKSGVVNKLAASISKSLSSLQAAQGIAGHVPSGPLEFVERDLLPALGPVELSVSGSSSTTLRAGLVIDPVNKSAGARLAGAVKRLVRGLPISASTVGGRVAVTSGFSNLQQLLNPSAKLGGNPTFTRALAQLPTGSRAGLYLNFSGIAALGALDPSAGGSETMRVLHRLDYLIAGGTHSHFRLVLATH